MAKIKVNELAKELGIKNNDLMSYLREKGVDAKSVTSMVDDDAIAIAESFFGKRKIKKVEPKPEAKSTRLFYKDGSVVHTKDSDGNPLPITGPVFDADGNLKKLTLDKNGFRIKPEKDEHGNITSAVYAYTPDGRLVRLAMKKDKAPAKEKPEVKEEAPAVKEEKATEIKEEKPAEAALKAQEEVKPAVKEPEEKIDVKPVTKQAPTRTERTAPADRPQRDGQQGDRKSVV